MPSEKPLVKSTAAIDSANNSSFFTALRYRDFRLLWIGQFVSVTGSQMQLAAINWHIWVLTKSSLALAMLGFFRVVPIIVCSLLGGMVADAFDRRKIMIGSQSLMLSIATVLAILTFRGLHSVWPIYILVAAGSAAFAFDNPARQSLLPLLVPKAVFTNAVSLGMIVFQFAMIVGPALTGYILAGHGPAVIYALNAGSFLAIIVSLLLIRAGRGRDSAAEERTRISLESFKDGFRFVRQTPIIVQTMTLDFIATFFASATALLPIFADQILKVGPRGYGWLMAAPAVGSVIAGLAMARLGTIRAQGKTVLVSVAIYGAATIVFGVSRAFWVSLLMLAVTGAADTVSTVLRQTIRQIVTPNNLRGRMTAINMVFFMGGPQLGEMEAGIVARWFGAPLSVVTGGIGCLIGVFSVMFCARTLVKYDGAVSREVTES